ncbi:hypothetical protein GAYE_SCF61G6513 [Galdieria yellowstonensis]|uniref:DDRGK domain-containing protein 1 n=1 Tax=Galdieria yellowstonensis TaxID=3028027 RepID=A0AAV9IMP4_9RHOD|nr:hypothetical protein GAYE_SCF61G6513 [Galdieria yellowstonensis]
MWTSRDGWILLFVVFCLILVLLFLLWQVSFHKKPDSNVASEDIAVRPLQSERGRSTPWRRHATQQENNTAEATTTDSASVVVPSAKKLKKKKEAHREAERERKQALAAAREAQRERLERERQREEEEREERERRKEERLAELERARREKEELEAKEYEKWKSSIELTEQGQEEEEVSEDLLPQFISYIMEKKLVVLEQLALEMNMKTEDVIQRIQSLQEQGQLTGVFDDRGKFIYISWEEMEAVANLITTRGRISIKELSRRCLDFIHLDGKYE